MELQMLLKDLPKSSLGKRGKEILMQNLNKTLSSRSLPTESSPCAPKLCHVVDHNRKPTSAGEEVAVMSSSWIPISGHSDGDHSEEIKEMMTFIQAEIDQLRMSYSIISMPCQAEALRKPPSPLPSYSLSGGPGAQASKPQNEDNKVKKLAVDFFNNLVVGNEYRDLASKLASQTEDVLEDEEGWIITNCTS